MARLLRFSKLWTKRENSDEGGSLLMAADFLRTD
jgi:hypothetical protein